ncbi:hypothetical protein Tco_1313012 [Tanacetum coccineum]
MKNRTIQNPKHQLPGQNLEKGTEAGIPEAHLRMPAYSKDSGRTDPLHRSPGHGRKGACLKDWEERNQLHPRVLIVIGEIPKYKELMLKQEDVNKGKHLRCNLGQYSESEDSEGWPLESSLRRAGIRPYEILAKPGFRVLSEIAMSFPPLSEEDGTEGPMIIEVEMGGHFVHRVYIDGGASSEVLLWSIVRNAPQRK